MNEIESSLERLDLEVDEQAMSHLTSNSEVKDAQRNLLNHHQYWHNYQNPVLAVYSPSPAEVMDAAKEGQEILETKMDLVVAVTLYKYEKGSHE